MSAYQALETQITTDIAADVSNVTTLVNSTIATAVRLIQTVTQRRVDDTDIYKEVKRLANTPNTARAVGMPHDWLK